VYHPVVTPVTTTRDECPGAKDYECENMNGAVLLSLKTLCFQGGYDSKPWLKVLSVENTQITSCYKVWRYLVLDHGRVSVGLHFQKWGHPETKV
jgi:hypothetical protein